MIRSLVATLSSDESLEHQIRRNLSQEHLAAAFVNDDLMWLDIVDPTDEEIHWLADELNLGPVIVKDLLSEDRRPALLMFPNYLFLSLFQPHIHRNRVEGKEVHCLVGETYFVTVRKGDSTAVDEAYERVANNPAAWERGIAYLLYLTSQHVIDMYYPLLDRISNQLNTVEENLLNNGAAVDNSARKPVYRIKQQLINLRQMVAPQREVLSNVIGEARLASNEDTRDLFRHLYERLLRVYDVIDSQRDLSSNVLDIMQNSESRRMVEAVNRLTIFSMIFLPLTFFTGLFELNFATTSDPIELPISGGVMFTVVVAAMIISALVMTIVFRRKGWI